MLHHHLPLPTTDDYHPSPPHIHPHSSHIEQHIYIYIHQYYFSYRHRHPPLNSQHLALALDTHNYSLIHQSDSSAVSSSSSDGTVIRHTACDIWRYPQLLFDSLQSDSSESSSAVARLSTAGGAPSKYGRGTRTTW